MMDRMLRAFEMWDVDGNGFIDADDIRAACEGLYVFLRWLRLVFFGGRTSFHEADL